MTPIRTEEVEGPVGFAGMAHMVSDADALLAAARRETAQTAPPVVQPSVSPRAEPPELKPLTASTSRWQFSYGWALGALTLFVFGVMLFTDPTKQSVSVSSSPIPSPPPVPAPRVPPSPVPEPSGSYTEEKPPIGKEHILTRAQLQYCLAENIRLEAGQLLIHDTNDAGSVQQFNDSIDDYNSRCGEFRYQKSMMERAKQEVEQQRSSLQAEGTRRLRIADTQSRLSPSSPQDNQGAAEEPRFRLDHPPAEVQNDEVSSPGGRSSAADERPETRRESDPATPLASTSRISAVEPRHQTDKAANLDKQQLLNPSEPNEADTAELAANLKECLDGRYPTLCNHARLTPAQIEDVVLAERRANLKQCLTGEYPFRCNHQRLTAAQALAVEEAERQAMFTVCLEGKYPALCQETLLLPDQQQAVSSARASAQPGASR